jgi:hypothetical protein
MTKKSVEHDFDISPKALFHVMFGERSPVFKNLYSQRRDKPVHQGHWKELDTGKMRRQFAYRVSSIDVFGMYFPALIGRIERDGLEGRTHR